MSAAVLASLTAKLKLPAAAADWLRCTALLMASGTAMVAVQTIASTIKPIRNGMDSPRDRELERRVEAERLCEPEPERLASLIQNGRWSPSGCRSSTGC